MQTVQTSVGPRKVDSDYDVTLLGGSGKNKEVYLDKDWKPVIKEAQVTGSPDWVKKLLVGMDRTPYVVEHEAVEADAEEDRLSYREAHYKRAEPAEHKRLLKDCKIPSGTPQAAQLIRWYERSYHQDIKDAAGKKNPDVPPNLIEKPYDHPHSRRARRLLAEVKAKEN